MPVTFPRDPVAAACPNCAAGPLRAFYAVPGVPIQSNLLMPTAADAAAVGWGDLRLATCGACGFITNVAFDPASQEMSARYEATQGFSPTFNKFAKSLAAGWAERFDLRGKNALEIGCGRGEFIAMLCDVADCHGVGIDPVADPARVPGDAAGGRVRLIADYYSERYADLPADFVCCRHTLEHIPDVRRFVSMLRRTIGGRAGVVVAFEVPDTLRVLAEGAFWDLYYEHCSYFTPGSLGRLFRECGFEVLDLRREYDGQYLILEAKPAREGGTGPDATDAEAAERSATLAAVERFPVVCGRQVDRWRAVIDGAAAAGKRVAVWGSGSKAVGFLTTLGVGADAVPYVIDINPNKHGTHLPGTAQRIVGPDVLRDYRPDVVIAMNPVYRGEIARDLDGLGVKAELLAL